MKRIHDGPAELTFADCASVLVPAERVLFTMIDEGEGALWIAPGTTPNMTEIETALESGPFTLTSEGLMHSCKPRRWIVREVTDSLCEMLVLFESATATSDPHPAQTAGAGDRHESNSLSAVLKGKFPRHS